MAVAAGLCLFLIGCEKEDIDRPTITRQAAEQQGDLRLVEVVGVVPAGITHRAPERSEGLCYHGNEHETDGRVQPSRSAKLGGPPGGSVADLYGAVRRYLDANGYRITSDDENYLAGTRPSDGFSVVLHGSLAPDDYMEVAVLAPCVWPDGTPSPKR